MAQAKKVLFIGRIALDTGYQTCVNWCKSMNYELTVASGQISNVQYLISNADFVFAGGYLVALEAWVAGKPVIVTWDNALKRDYWQMHPMHSMALRRAIEWAKAQTWEKLADVYENLWQK